MSVAEGFRVRVCLRGMGLFPGMSHADASIRKSGLEIANRCTEVPETNLDAAAIAKSGLEIRNRCTEVPEICPIAAAIVKLTPSNQESLHGYP